MSIIFPLTVMIFNNFLTMVISIKENQDLHAILFENKENYNKWASCFYDEFVMVYSELNGSIAGVMTPNLVRIDEDVNKEFFQWLEEKVVNVAQK